MACSHPRIINKRLVPCGCCVNCRKKRINDWTVRLDMERRLCKNKCVFVTLTYREEDLPDGGILDKRDYQLFLKRLRITLFRYEDIKIRYFLSGEYGKKFGRPHFHLIIFNLEKSQEHIDLIEKCWNKGFVKVLSVTFENCRYVAKYCIKQFAKQRVFTSTNLDTGEVTRYISKEFVSMSRKNGLGYCILKNEMWKQYCNQRYIQVGDYHFSVPYSLIRKAKELKLETPAIKLNIIYNEEKFPTFDEFKRVGYGYKSFLNYIDENWYSKFYFNDSNVNFISFKDYFKDFLEISEREKNFCKLRKIDFHEFYKNYCYKFPLFFKWKNAEETLKELYFKFSDRQFRHSEYLDFFKSFVYMNFDYLFY